MSKLQVTRVGTPKGGAVIRSRDNIIPLINAWPGIKQLTLRAGAESLEQGFIEAYRTGGFGMWTQKSPEQQGRLMREGAPFPSVQMAGKTLALRTNIETFGPAFTGSTDAWAVGWGDKPHPDPGFLGSDRNTPQPTMGQIAWAHEVGVKEGGVVTTEDGGWGGAGGSIVRIPERPWASLVADVRGDRIVTLMRTLASKQIGSFNSIPIPPP